MSDINRDAAIRRMDFVVEECLTANGKDPGWYEAFHWMASAVAEIKALPLAAPATESQSPLMNDEARLEGRQGKPDAAVPQVPLRETPPVSAATPAPCKALSGGTCDCFDPAAPVAPSAPRWTAWEPAAFAEEVAYAIDHGDTTHLREWAAKQMAAPPPDDRQAQKE